MNLYLVKRENPPTYPWDMYHGFVIASSTIERAVEIALKTDSQESPEWEAQLISDSSIYEEETIVMSDYCAG